MPHSLFRSTLLLLLLVAGLPSRATPKTSVDAGFRLLYETKFEEARSHFIAWEKANPQDPLGHAWEAASYLFEDLYRKGVLRSEFFLNDKTFLDTEGSGSQGYSRNLFLAATSTAEGLAKRRLTVNPQDTDALLALTVSCGMLADYASLIERRQIESLKFIRRSQTYAKDLLAVKPDSADAYLALGAANYIIGSLPAHKRFFLWLGGIEGDKQRGFTQLGIAATRGEYLRPFAKILLALVALREKRAALARTQLEELTAEFPENPLFARELALLGKS